MLNSFIVARYRGPVLALALVVSGAAASADTIVLKNGRRILAFNVVEAGEKIRYETRAGELSLPKSIVDHIEKGGLLPMAAAGSGVANAANLAITPPSMDTAGNNGGEIERAVIHDGAIDRQYIAKLEGETRSGSPAA